MMRKYHVRFGGGPLEKGAIVAPRQRPTLLSHGDVSSSFRLAGTTFLSTRLKPYPAEESDA